jgi:hypothetical protein
MNDLISKDQTIQIKKYYRASCHTLSKSESSVCIEYLEVAVIVAVIGVSFDLIIIDLIH